MTIIIIHYTIVSKLLCESCIYNYYGLSVQDFVYPEDVAYPIGGPGTPDYMVIEIHYDNPDFDAGIYIL